MNPKFKGRKKNLRNQIYPTTLFSGILCCGYCGGELQLYRSAAGDKQCFCRNSHVGRHDCNLTASKSLNIIEPIILDYVINSILQPDIATQIVEVANQYLEEEKAKPLVDTSGLKATLDNTKASQKRLIELVKGDDGIDMKPVREEIKRLSATIRSLDAELAAANSQQQQAFVSPLQIEDILKIFENVRSILNMDVVAANEALRKLLGKIYVRQVESDGRKPVWVARIKTNIVPLLAEYKKKDETPNSCVLGPQAAQEWSFSIELELPLRKPFKYEVIAKDVQLLREQGKTWPEISSAMGCIASTCAQAYRYVTENIRPAVYSKTLLEARATNPNVKGRASHVEKISETVMGLREQGMTQQQIADHFGVSRNIVQIAIRRAELRQGAN